MRLCALILFPRTALVVAQGRELVAVTLGSKWGNVSPMLEVFTLLSSVSAISAMGQSNLYARGKPGALFRITVQSAFLRVIIVAAAPWIGMGGMIAGLAATTIFISFQLISSVCKELDVSLSTILHQLFLAVRKRHDYRYYVLANRNASQPRPVRRVNKLNRLLCIFCSFTVAARSRRNTYRLAKRIQSFASPGCDRNEPDVKFF